MDAGLRVALVHDWLTGMRGGEKVLEVLCDLFPQAPLYTMLHVPGSVSATIENRPIRTSELQRLPFAKKYYRHYLPLLPKLAERIRIEPCDLVLSVSSCAAKGVRKPAGAKHASYILSPMRYLYDQFDDYFRRGRAGLATRLGMKLLRKPLQKWDRRSAAGVDSFAAVSRFIAGRIRDAYGADATVVYPHVDYPRFANLTPRQGDYYLMVAALVPYKNADVAVEAFRGLDRKLVVAGAGPMLARLRENPPPNVELLGWVDDGKVEELLAGCRAFLMPNVEDFGIAPIEAMAAGKPVIALGAGGVLDTVRDLARHQRGTLPGSGGPTGLFFADPTPASLAAAIAEFEREESEFESAAIRRWARTFDRPNFEAGIRRWLTTTMGRTARRAA
jgi:glycosyltransferase involved in cell wall biosynthesis